MIRLFRKLKISLATKCQLLFGASVVLVIGAALFVPWQRMEQLSEQPNESAARLLAQAAIRDHIDRFSAESPRPLARTRRASATTQAAEPAPKLIGIDQIDSPTLSRFENGSLHVFQRDPKRDYRSSLLHTTERYRFAQPLLNGADCIRCHAAPESPASLPIAMAGTRPSAEPQLLGIVSVDIPSQTSGQQQLLNRVLLLIAGLIAVTLAGVTMYLIITRIILQPVRVLQETAEKVSAGDLNIRSHIRSGDEFQQLSETFNQMLANLKTSNDRLREMNKSLDVRLGQLEEANDALFESNRLKSEFLASVSHELRTPLNSILGFAELLRDQMPDESKQARYLQNIVRSGANLLDLINDLLDLAKIEAGKMAVRAQPLSLGDVFEGLVNLLKLLSEGKKLSIDIQVDADVPVIETDAARLQQILYNFLSNAIKFSPDKETIRLHAERTDGGVRISVTDRGPGIPLETQKVIFEKFRQGDQSYTRQHGGTGLGLAIARELAQLLGGKIGVISTEGEGAQFWVELPLKIDSGDREIARPA
ncbi:MAG: ATP-binding protein [Tepidisphaeraceae bacterium]